jgi:glycosyltransferase involved in cell wall biosynthesis
MKVICFLSTWYGPSGRFRFLQYEKEFAKKGYNMKYAAIYPMRHYSPKFSVRILNKIIARCIEPLRMLHILLSGFRLPFYDAVFLNKDISGSSRIHWYEKYFLFFNKNIYFDLDDAIFFANKGQRDKKFKVIFPLLKGIIVSNKYLKEYAAQYNPNTVVIPMGIDMDIYTGKVFDPTRKEMIIGWSGSDRSYETTFPSIIPALEKLGQRQKVKVLIIKNTNPNLNIPNVEVEFIAWSKETEVESVKKMDIGLMPLIEDEFQRYKSALKALQYMAVGIPALVSPIGINSSIVEHGVHGYHCANENDWIIYIEKCINDRSLIEKLGKQAREKILHEHALSVLVNDYVRFIK